MQRDTAKRMIEAAGLFLDSLAPEQRATVLLGQDSGARMNWDYRPHERAGLSLKGMDSSQQKLAYALLTFPPQILRILPSDSHNFKV